MFVIGDRNQNQQRDRMLGGRVQTASNLYIRFIDYLRYVLSFISFTKGLSIVVLLLRCILQIARMVVVIAATFLLLWSPFYLVTFVTQVQEISFLTEQNFLFTMLSTHLIGFTNSAVNPFIYAMLGDKFRTAFMVSALHNTSFCLPYTEWSNK